MWARVDAVVSCDGASEDWGSGSQSAAAAAAMTAWRRRLPSGHGEGSSILTRAKVAGLIAII